MTAEAVEKHLAEEHDNAPEAAMLNQITAVTREDKVCIDLTADDDADAEEDRNTSSSNNALLRTRLDPAMTYARTMCHTSFSTHTAVNTRHAGRADCTG